MKTVSPPPPDGPAVSPESKSSEETVLESHAPNKANPEELAERYLDLWQDNLTFWATDPAALKKWLAEQTAPVKPAPDGSSPD